MYLNEMVHVTGMASRSIEIELRNLSRLGLLGSSRDRSRIYYTADRSNPAYPGLATLVAATAGLVGLLQESLALSDIEFVFIPSQDPVLLTDHSRELPLVIVLQRNSRNLDETLREASNQVGRTLSPRIITLDDAKSGLFAHDPGVSALFNAEKSFVIGRGERMMERLFVHAALEPAPVGPSPS